MSAAPRGLFGAGRRTVAATAEVEVSAERWATRTSPWCGSPGKRALDLVGAVVLGMGALPLGLLAAAAIRLTCGSPVLYRQVRLGRGFRPFLVHKLRTMRVDAERSTGPVLAALGDPRITPLGRMLRRTRIDELPQLWNVLRGEMSLVGPRPERPVFVRQFMHEIPGYAERFAVLPGLTGPAQVAESYSATAAEKLRHDVHYRRFADLFYDVKVLLQTVLVMIRANGR